MKKNVDNISLEPVAVVKSTAAMSVSVVHASAPTVSVAASDECSYRICKRVTDFFYTVKAKLFKFGEKIRKGFRFRPIIRRVALPVCCGYSRTVLGWRL